MNPFYYLPFLRIEEKRGRGGWRGSSWHHSVPPSPAARLRTKPYVL